MRQKKVHGTRACLLLEAWVLLDPAKTTQIRVTLGKPLRTRHRYETTSA